MDRETGITLFEDESANVQDLLGKSIGRRRLESSLRALDSARSNCNQAGTDHFKIKN